MNRYCFIGHVAPANLDAYRRVHAHVCPELLVALRDAGWCNYSLHLRGDGLLVGYVESENLDEAQARIAATRINRRWQERMAALFEGDGAPDEAWEFLDEVFHLETQLSAAGMDSGSGSLRTSADGSSWGGAISGPSGA